jgi:Tfp pilus assembly protein PilO
VQHYDTITRQPVQIGWQGNYHDLVRVLHQLEQLPHALWLEELKIELPREAGEGLHCELRLDAFASKSEESGQRKTAANR